MVPSTEEIQLRYTYIDEEFQAKIAEHDVLFKKGMEVYDEWTNTLEIIQKIQQENMEDRRAVLEKVWHKHLELQAVHTTVTQKLLELQKEINHHFLGGVIIGG
jgi:hypothetical protein